MAYMDNDFDILPYIRNLLENRRQIIIYGATAAVIALIVSLILPAKYLATATVLFTRSRATLSLAEQFPTISEPTDTKSRMDAILAIAESDGIAMASLVSVTANNPQVSLDLEAIRKAVRLSTKGDVIQISATARDPMLAADIANTWAQEATVQINQAYSGEQPLSEIQSQLDIARHGYERSQVQLEQFLKENKIDLLQIQIRDVKEVLTSYEINQSRLAQYYRDRQLAMERLISQSQALREQLANEPISKSASAGDSLAVLRARMQTFSVISENPVDTINLELQLADLTPLADETSRDLTADIDALILLAESEKIKSRAALDNLVGEVAMGQDSEPVMSISAQLRLLNSELEQQQAMLKDLTSERNLALAAYNALAEKEVELRNAAQTRDMITLASRAIPPMVPASPAILKNVMIAAMLGLIIGIAWTFVLQWWRTQQVTSLRTAMGAEADAG